MLTNPNLLLCTPEEAESSRRSRSVTCLWDIVLWQDEEQRGSATIAPACLGARHLSGLQRRPSGVSWWAPALCCCASPRGPACRAVSIPRAPPRPVLPGTWAYPPLQHKNLFRGGKSWIRNNSSHISGLGQRGLNVCNCYLEDDQLKPGVLGKRNPKSFNCINYSF